jgi:hypothetical protein
MHILVPAAALAAFAFGLPQAAPAQGCAALAEQRTRLAAEYQMNQAVIADWKGIAKKKRERRRAEKIGRTAANVGLNLLLPFPLGAAANLGLRGAESAITGKPLLARPKPTSSAAVEALRARNSVIVARLARSERARGCNFYAGRSAGRSSG